MQTNKTSMKPLKNSLMFLGIVVIFFATVSAVSASSTSSTLTSSTIYVNGSNGNDDNDGTSWEWAKKTITNATNTVTSGGTIYIANGNYNEHEIQANKDMVIIGESQKYTVIDAHGTNRIFTNTQSGVHITLINLTVQNGNNTPKYDGGAIHINGGGVFTVINCTFKNNSAKSGGAIINHGSLTLSGCTFTGNNAMWGSGSSYLNCGGAVFSDGTLTITNCTFNDNAASQQGGAIYNGGTINSVSDCNFNSNAATSGSAVYNTNIITSVKGCIFTDNTATSYGGAILNSGTISVNDCNFNTNAADYGGAIANSRTINSVSGCTFMGNTATSDGGAIYNVNTLNVINNCIFTGNSANRAGAIYNHGYLTVNGSIFTNNAAKDRGGAIYIQSGISQINFCRIAGNNAAIGKAIYCESGSVNAEKNWWGSNSNPKTILNLIRGTTSAEVDSVDTTPWIYMTINADPKTIKNGETSHVTVSFNNQFDGATITSLNPANGYIPDGTPVTFSTDKGSIGCKTIDKETSGGTATATLTADETAGMAHLSAVTDDQTVNTEVTITAVSCLNLTVKTNNTHPVAGDIVLYTLKISNSGPDVAKDAAMTYVIPEGLEFAGADVDMGDYTYDPATRTITWTIDEVPVGDPYMWLSLRVAQAGNYSINPILSTSTYDPTLNSSVHSLAVSAAPNNTNTNDNNGNSTGNTTHAVTNVNAAVKTSIGLQETGLPFNYLILAIIMVIGGLVPRRK